MYELVLRKQMNKQKRKKKKHKEQFYGIRITEILLSVLIINKQELSHLFPQFNVPKCHFTFFFEMVQKQYRQSHTTFIKLASYVFPSLGEHSLQCWDTLEFHYVEVVAQSAEIIFSSSKAAQSLAFGWALTNSFPSFFAVHWREGLMVNGAGDDHWQFSEILYTTLISKKVNTQDHSTASYT